MTSGTTPPVVDADRFDAVLFDLDGVITDTAKVHSAAWAQMFDEFLQARAEAEGGAFVPFTPEDYLHYVDGKPRYDGVRDFLTSRGITLPEGSPESPPEEESVGGLGNRKNVLMRTHLAEHGVEVFDGTIRWMDTLVADGIHIAVVSSSRDTTLVLQAAGLSDRFEAQVDGLIRAELGLAGKPAPDTYLEAARRLGVGADRAVVVEDAISGVQAGHAGDFGLVIGVDRTGIADALHENGADVVVADLGELCP